jgi:hypothetical protein
MSSHRFTGDPEVRCGPRIFRDGGWCRVGANYQWLLLSGFILCQACAGRALQLVDVVQAKDRTMDCAAIMAEVKANNQKMQELATEQSWKVAQNVAAGVAGIIIWPL